MVRDPSWCCSNIDYIAMTGREGIKDLDGMGRRI